MTKPYCRLLSILLLSVFVHAGSLAEVVSFYAASNLVKIEVPEGLKSAAQNDHAEFSSWAAQITPDTQTRHDIFARYKSEKWDHYGRRVYVTSLNGFSLAISELRWIELRDYFLATSAESGDLTPPISLENMVEEGYSFLGIEPKGMEQIVELFLEELPSAVWVVGYANRHAVDDGNPVEFDYIVATVYMMISGTPMLLQVSSNPLNESNVVEEATWVLEVANELVRSTEELNPWTYGDIEMFEAQAREGKLQMLLSAVFGAVFMAVLIGIQIYKKKKSSRSVS